MIIKDLKIINVNDLDKYTIKPDAIKDIITSKRYLIIL